MMARYVDIDDIIKTFEKLHGEESALLNCYNADWIVSFLQAQPTADVTEVVRCKDCKYYPTSGLPNQSCPMWNNEDDFLGSYWKGNDNGFCNYGERRKEDAEIY